jgi:hypothetical protein
MTVIRIPNGLKVTAMAYSVGAPSGVKRTEVAGGASRYAMEWDRGTQQFGIQLVLDPQQLSIWTVFFLRIIRKGAITFVLPIDSGMGLQDHDCNIVPGTYATTRQSGFTAVSFTVEAMPTAFLLSDADANAMVDVWNTLGDQTSSLLDLLEHFVKVDSTVLDF